MPLFEYTGFDAAGKKVSGILEGSGRRALLSQLRQQGIHATSLKEEKKGAATQRSWLTLLPSRIPRSDVAIATRQLATLIGAGLALDVALATVADQQENQQLGRILAGIRDEVVQGDALHIALGRRKRIFIPLYINMVQVGENSGSLDQVLDRLADFLEEQARLQGRITTALAYPVLMAIVGVGVLFFLVSFVLPKVTRMLEDLDQALPLATRLLIGFSELLGSYGWILVILLAVAITLLIRWKSTEPGQLALHRFILRLPVIGRFQLLVATARFSRTLGTLLQSGIPLLKALTIASNLLQNRVLHNVVEEAGDSIREGEGLAAPLRRSQVFPPMLAQMIAVGEKSGDLEHMLFKVADAYEHQIELSLAGMLALLEPLMILLMGSAVGFIVLAILLPIFQASSGMG
jgi:general secretion pathway protein F